MAADLQDLKVRAAQRLAAVQKARVSLLPFMQLSMPDPEDVDDATRSRYVETPQARLLAEVLEKVEQGIALRSKAPPDALRRVAVSIGPQLGKSEIISRGFPAWFVGKNPDQHVILGTYNSDRAKEEGAAVRGIMRMPFYKHVFPGFELRTGSEAKDHMVTHRGGQMAFVGVGGSGSGKPSDLFVIDDPFKNEEDANSDIYRETVWGWFNKVAVARAKGNTAIVIIHTRWHEDDLIGRLCDPTHPERNKKYKGVAERWTYINLPAVVDDPKLAQALGLTLEEPTEPRIIEQFGCKPIASLWEQQKPLRLLAEARQLDKNAFEALYMGRPAPDEGAYFKADWLVEYELGELPERLRYYGASDHAASEKQTADETVLGCVGVDEDDTLWVLPDLFIGRVETDQTVEELLAQMKAHRPLIWWMERELISRSFGPFLKKRMLETSTYCYVDPVVVSKDKQLRARAIQGRMAMKKVRFPAFAPWWPAVRKQLLTFPHATHDDFVDWLAHIGAGLMKEVSADPVPKGDNVIRVGSFAWIKQAANADRRAEEIRKARLG